MEFERASLEYDGAVAILRMNHPEVLNALSPEMLQGMTDALDAIAKSDGRTRCLVLTGTGRAFSTGANLQGRGGNDAMPRGAGHTLETVFHPFIRRLRDLPYPIVTAVNGAAAGAGMSVALMGDLVLCARSAYFLQAFRRIGLVPDCGSTWLLPRLIGEGAALELLLAGRPIDPGHALRMGLVHHLSDDALATALELATTFAARPAAAVAATKRLLRAAAEGDLARAVDLEAGAQAAASHGSEFADMFATWRATRIAD